MLTTTTTVTTEYSAKFFNTLRDIRPQRLAFDERDGDSFVMNTLGPLINKHKHENVFGVVIVHRHFDLKENEMLIESGNTSVPYENMTVGLNWFSEDYDSLVYETSWMINPDTDKWMGYEFGLSVVRGKDKHIVDIHNPKYAEFLAEYQTAIKEGGWETIFGLRAWPGDGFNGNMEFTQGRANICLEPSQYPEPKGGGKKPFTTTTWFFESGNNQLGGCKNKCLCLCRTNRVGGHVGHGHS